MRSSHAQDDLKICACSKACFFRDASQILYFQHALYFDNVWYKEG